MTTCELGDDLQYFLELQKQRLVTKTQEKNELVQEKKTFKSSYFQISYLHHFLFILNNLKSYESTI